MIIPNIWENKKWQPNHQPAKVRVFPLPHCVLLLPKRTRQLILPPHPRQQAQSVSKALPSMKPKPAPGASVATLARPTCVAKILRNNGCSRFLICKRQFFANKKNYFRNFRESHVFLSPACGYPLLCC